MLKSSRKTIIIFPLFKVSKLTHLHLLHVVYLYVFEAIRCHLEIASLPIFVWLNLLSSERVIDSSQFKRTKNIWCVARHIKHFDKRGIKRFILTENSSRTFRLQLLPSSAGIKNKPAMRACSYCVLVCIGMWIRCCLVCTAILEKVVVRPTRSYHWLFWARTLGYS